MGIDAAEIYVDLKLQELNGTTVNQDVHDAALLRGWPLQRVIDPRREDYIPNAAVPHPITDSNESLFASVPDIRKGLKQVPEVGATLEAFRRDAQTDTSDKNPDLPDLDMSHVLTGARWLRNHADPESSIFAFADEIVLGNTSAKSSAARPASFVLPAANIHRVPTEQEIIGKRRLDIESHAEGFAADYRTQDEADMFALADFVALACNLRVFDHEGEVVVTKKPPYQLVLSELSSRLVADPQQYVHFSSLLVTAAESEKDYEGLDPAARQIFNDVIESMAESNQRLSSETANQWLTLADELPKTFSYENLKNPGSLLVNAETLDADVLAQVAGVRLGAELIGNYLEETVERADTPEEVVDILHDFANKGIDPDAPLKTRLTLDILKRTMETNNTANLTLRCAPTSNVSPEHQLKAIDLMYAFMLFEEALTPSSALKRPISLPPNEQFERLFTCVSGNSIALRRHLANMCMKVSQHGPIMNRVGAKITKRNLRAFFKSGLPSKDKSPLLNLSRMKPDSEAL